MDTALLLAGALFCRVVLRPERRRARTAIRALADSLYARVDWRWAQPRPPTIAHGWKPESGFLPYDWRGYNEAMILYLLALGSPTHPVDPKAWAAWTAATTGGASRDTSRSASRPSSATSTPRSGSTCAGSRTSTCARAASTTSRTRAARHWPSAPTRSGTRAAGAATARTCWGLTACDGPLDQTLDSAGGRLEFHTYWGRGASCSTPTTTARSAPRPPAARSPFAPEIAVPALVAMRESYGAPLFSTYGFRRRLQPHPHGRRAGAPRGDRRRGRAGSTPTTSGSTRVRSSP